jgi:succinate dehydrogenase / fumarate reductase flavoprotein subunit
LHKKLGKVMWEYCGMGRNEQGLLKARDAIKGIKEEFWKDVRIPGTADELNPELEKAARVADFIELGALMVEDALQRRESCGGHFREESQTPEGEAQRDDANFSFVSAWEYSGENPPLLNKEPLNFEVVHPTQRSYK